MEALNPQAFSRETGVTYPYFKAINPDESFQLVCKNLEIGEYPLCLLHKGTMYKIMNISLSAYNIQRLLNSIKLSIVTAGGQYDINSMEDYMEGVKLWI